MTTINSEKYKWLSDLLSNSVCGEEIGLRIQMESGINNLNSDIFLELITILTVGVWSDNANIDKMISNFLYIVRDTDLADSCICTQDCMDSFDMILTKYENSSRFQYKPKFTVQKLREMLTKIFKWKQKKLGCSKIDMTSMAYVYK